MPLAHSRHFENLATPKDGHIKQALTPVKSQIALYLFCAASLWAALALREPYNYRFRRAAKSHPPIKARAYVLGEKSHLSRSELKAHRKLHLMHLFTPSGMHLTALLCLPAWFLRRKRKIFFAVLATVFVCALALGAPESFRRMCLILGLGRICRRFNFAIVGGGFFLDFLITLALRGWGLPSVSWSMSLLFMGTIVLQRLEPKRSLYMGLLGAQALIGVFFQQAVSPLGLLLGWVMVALFPCFFPLFLVESLLWPSFSASSLYLFLVQILAQAAGPAIPAYLGLGFTALYFFKLWPFVFYRLGHHPGLVLLGLALFPYRLPNLPRHYQRPLPFPAPPPRTYQSKTIHTWGVKFHYRGGMVCRSRLYHRGWSTRCRK